MLAGRIIMEIKSPNTNNEICKDRSVFQGLKHTEKNFLVHDSQTVRIRNIRLLSTLSAIYQFEVINRDVTQSYVSKEKVSHEVYP